MSGTSRPTGHLQVKTDQDRRTRSFYAFWRDQNDERGGCRLGPAHVRDSGRRTPRGAIIWRAGNGPRPTPEHLTPKDAEERLDAILHQLEDKAQLPSNGAQQQATLRQVTEEWLAERRREKGLKRSTLTLYNVMFERLYRDLGADTQVRDFADGRLRAYFDDFKSYKVRGVQSAKKARAFWLCGAHAGLRLSGEALGLRWGAVDFQAGVIRPYDNWVLGELDTTKTGDSEAIPMTPRLARALAKLKQRGYATGDEDFVFASGLAPDRPVPDRPFREAFKVARQKAGLKPIKMYNLRHSFGTSLAGKGVDVRTTQALMRHARLNTTEQYMAYAPRPKLANQITRALDPRSLPENVLPLRPASRDATATFLERLEDAIPAKWLAEVRRRYAETAAQRTA